MDKVVFKITEKNTNYHCRTCLAEITSGSKHIINDLQFSDVLLSFLSLDKNENYLPGLVCHNCFEKISLLDEFRNTSIRSRLQLESILESLTAVENDDWLKFNCDYRAVFQTPIKVKNNLQNIIVKKMCKIDTFADANSDTVENVYGTNKLRIKSETRIESTKFKLDMQSLDEEVNTKYITAAGSDSSSNFSNSKITKRRGTEATSALRNKCKEINKKEVKTKLSETKYRCELCPRRFICKENLDAHIRTHRGLKPFQCAQCECSYVQASRLRRHIREKHTENFKRKEEKETICSFKGCGKVFHREASYKAHYRIKHSDSKPVWKTYICEDCGRVCKNISLLRKHCYTHRPVNEYPYKCEHCGKYFITKCHYKEHLLRHAGIKKFECPHCGMKKTTMTELRTHINYHTKEKQWSCKLCPSIFSNAVNLRRHDRVVHQGIRSYTCRFCNESFGKPDTLKHHEMRHTGEKPHVCSVCSKRFIQAIALKTHMKIHFKKVEKTESPTQDTLVPAATGCNNNVL